MNHLEGLSAEYYYWMSHIGDLTFFQMETQAARFLCDDQETEPRKFVNWTLANCLRLGHIEGIANGAWRVVEPSMYGASGINYVVWKGGLSHSLIRKIEQAATDNHCKVDIIPRKFAPPFVKFVGNTRAITNTAQLLNTPFQKDGSNTAAMSLRPIDDYKLETVYPVGDNSFFDIERMDWTKLPFKYELVRFALLHKDRLGRNSYYYVDNGNASLVQCDTYRPSDNESIAIYLAAAKGTLAYYDATSNEFRAKVQLPTLYSTVLCQCSGNLPTRPNKRHEVYKSVSPQVADYMLNILKQVPNTQSIYWLKR